MIEGGEVSGSSDNIDVDALLAEIEQPSGDRSVASDQPEPAAASAPQAPAAPQPAQEFEITANGQVIKAPVDKVRQWASQGYDYAQKMQALKAEQEQFGSQRSQWESQYKPIDDYIKTNPQWWEHVQRQWQDREKAIASLDPAHPLAPELQAVRQQLAELNQFKTQFAEEKAQQQRAQEDSKLDTEIKSIREQYPDLGWDSVDESGKSLEVRVLEHAMQHDIKNFRAAFRDFHHDQLIKSAEERGKEAINKDIQKKTKLGLLGKSPAPQRQAFETQDVKNKSYDDLAREALEELGLAGAS